MKNVHGRMRPRPQFPEIFTFHQTTNDLESNSTLTLGGTVWGEKSEAPLTRANSSIFFVLLLLRLRLVPLSNIYYRMYAIFLNIQYLYSTRCRQRLAVIIPVSAGGFGQRNNTLLTAIYRWDLPPLHCQVVDTFLSNHACSEQIHKTFVLF